MKSQKKSESTASSKTKKERFIKSWNRKVASSTTREYRISERGVLMKKEETSRLKMQKLRASWFLPNDRELYD